MRAFQAADAPLVFAAIDRTMARFMVWDPAASLEAFQRTGLDWLARLQAGTDLPLIVIHTGSGDFLGMATLQNVHTREPRAGIWLKEGAHGKGYGREAGLAVLAWAARELGAEAVHYPVVAGDIPSRRLAESLGGKKGETSLHRKATGVELRVMDFRIPTDLAIPQPPRR